MAAVQRTAPTAVTAVTDAAYVPPPESQGGWRWLRTPDEVRAVGGMDLSQLRLAAEYNALLASTTSSVVEWHEVSALATTRYDVWSCTKSFTGTAYRVLLAARPEVGWTRRRTSTSPRATRSPTRARRRSRCATC
ncbi:MAG: hypothetical protein ACRDJN_23985 [Chloroflexota bacterium]